MPVNFFIAEGEKRKVQKVWIMNNNVEVASRAINPNIQDLCRLTINIFEGICPNNFIWHVNPYRSTEWAIGPIGAKLSFPQYNVIWCNPYGNRRFLRIWLPFEYYEICRNDIHFEGNDSWGVLQSFVMNRFQNEYNGKSGDWLYFTINHEENLNDLIQFIVDNFHW